MSYSAFRDFELLDGHDGPPVACQMPFCPCRQLPRYDAEIDGFDYGNPAPSAGDPDGYGECQSCGTFLLYQSEEHDCESRPPGWGEVLILVGALWAAIAILALIRLYIDRWGQW